MHAYMRRYNRTTVTKGVQAVKEGQLDAFIYDATVLEYLVGQDSECVLLTVGSWFAMTGYGIGFPRHSKYRALINNRLMEYRETGDLERLQRFWFTGACNKRVSKEKQSRSEPLALEQFFSTFLLLGSGILLAGLLLLLEAAYCKYVDRHACKETRARKAVLGCCSLVSRSLGHSLRPRQRSQKAPRGLATRPHSCRELGCGAARGRLEVALGEAHRRIAELEADLRLYGGLPVCQVHGPRGRPPACLPLRFRAATSPHEYAGIPCEVAVDRCTLWGPPVFSQPDQVGGCRCRRRRSAESREIETVL